MAVESPVPLHSLPLTETLTPADVAAVSAAVKGAHGSNTPVYPMGGGTSGSYGRPATREGIGLSLVEMNRIVDYPSRDMTITVEAGLTMGALHEALLAENQELPVDVPVTDHATVGGVLATNWNGPRRLGYGPLRDWVIGVEAVDGSGLVFHGGGRVVKNVAGYDFCKLLTGSLGTLGVITQVTLKVRPIAPARGTLACSVDLATNAELFLSKLGTSSLRPVAVNLMAGVEKCDLAVTFEGSQAEVQWQLETLKGLWQTLGETEGCQSEGFASQELLQQVVEFPAQHDSAIVLKATVTPSGVCPLMLALRQWVPQCELLAHAASGIVLVRMSEEPDDLGQLLQTHLRPLAAKYHGQVTLVSRRTGGEMTQQMVWGGLGDSLQWMQRVKHEFDPAGILNPQRFVF